MVRGKLEKLLNHNPLDEMNLSHVERYFSDFLSALESNEPIPLHNASTDKYSSVTIPSNLFVIGTVNIDETTYMFSPKVLDRANTIEFDVFNADAYLHGKIENNHSFHNVTYLENPLETSNNAAMTIEDIREAMNTIAISENELFWEVFSRELTKFQTTLKPYRLSFGFRVINEIARFMYVAWNYEGCPKQWPQWNRYFDAQIKQKILPKIHGSKRMLGTLLLELIDLCINDDTILYETSYKKLEEMQKILDDQRYVSFTC